MKSLIQKLCEAPGPSGYEMQVRTIVRLEVEAYADELRVDALGNLIVRQGEKNDGGRCILVCAHLDEPGVIVTHIDSSGFAHIAPIGNASADDWAGRAVRFLNGAAGVVAARDRIKKDLSFEQLYIDLGSQAAQASPVKTGDAAVAAAPFLDLGGRISGKALNNRTGAAILVEMVRRRPARAVADELVFVFSTQSRVGQRGAGTAAFDLQPDLALVVETVPEREIHKEHGAPTNGAVLGKGPAVPVRAANTITDPAVMEWITQTAEKAGIDCQATIEPGRLEARAIQESRAGVPAGTIAVPCRYPGTGIEMVDLGDVEKTLQLAMALIERPSIPAEAWKDQNG